MGPPGPSSSQYGSRYSMSRTCGPRDIISLVIPRLGDNTRVWFFRIYDFLLKLGFSKFTIPSFIDLNHLSWPHRQISLLLQEVLNNSCRAVRRF
jgi:hypothetical protein